MVIGVWNNSLLMFLTYNIIIVNMDIAKGHALSSMRYPATKYESVIGTVPNADRSKDDDLKQFSKIGVIRNGSVIMRGRINNGTHLHKFSLLKLLPGVTKKSPALPHSNGKWDIKVYGDGTELKLPPFFERVVQRIQTYFSVYKYTDTSAMESTVIPGEIMSPQITIEPTNNVTTATILSFSGNSLDDNSNKKSEDKFSSVEANFYHQQVSLMDFQSTTQEDINEYTEFTAIDEPNNEFIVVGEN